MEHQLEEGIHIDAFFNPETPTRHLVSLTVSESVHPLLRCAQSRLSAPRGLDSALSTEFDPPHTVLHAVPLLPPACSR